MDRGDVRDKGSSGGLVVNTPYDDVFRTLLNDCRGLIIPLPNEIFGGGYTGDERIEFAPNEHFLNQQDGDETKRITDTSFTVIGREEKKYLLECQCTADSSMLVRIFEYATQIGLDQGSFSGTTLKVTIPHSAVLFLLPFYISTHEHRFKEYDKDKEKLGELEAEYISIMERLDGLLRTGRISAYTYRTIIEMSGKVVENIAHRYENVRKGVRSVMGGKILEYEAKTILNQGIDQGIDQGIRQQAQRTAHRMLAAGRYDLEEVAEISGLTLADVEALYREMPGGRWPGITDHM